MLLVVAPDQVLIHVDGVTGMITGVDTAGELVLTFVL